MVKRTVAILAVLALIICFSINVAAAKPKQNPAEAVQFLAESYAFGTGEDSAAENFLSKTLKEFPLSSATAKQIKSAYAAKLQSGMTVKTTIKKNDPTHPVVTVTTTPANVSAADANELLALKVDAVLGVDNAAYQARALQTIGKFIEKISFRKAPQSFDVTCVQVKDDDGNSYWVTEDTIAFQNFLVPHFEMRSTTEIKEFLGGLGGGIEPFTPPVKPPTKPDSVKPDKPSTNGDKWLIYWYACGTDIETSRILFDPSTDLLSNKIVLAEPTRRTGDITRCIRELEKANLSADNVTVLMQAGGTMVWGHEKFRDNNAIVRVLNEQALNKEQNINAWQFNAKVDEERTGQKIYTDNINVENPYKISRYVFSNKERDWKPHEVFNFDPNNPVSKMGSQAGLEAFLRYGKELEKELYPDGNVRRLFIFRDHGGGSLYGICWDEYSRNMLNAENLSNSTSIQLEEIRAAFNAVWGTSPETTLHNSPFEVVAFDACQMSTYETAVSLEGIAHYMVASQRPTAGRNSYAYDNFITRLSENPTMSGEELGKTICNTYWDDTIRTDREYADIDGGSEGTNSLVTISVTDITKIPDVTVAYENFGNALSEVAGNFQNDFVRQLNVIKNENVTENYGNNMFDLKCFAQKAGETFPNVQEASNKLIDTVNGAVIYNVLGKYSYRGGGLSTYYPTTTQYANGRMAIIGLNRYKELAEAGFATQSMKKLYFDMYRYSSKSQTPQKNEIRPTDDFDAENFSIPEGSPFDLRDLAKVKVKLNKKTKTALIKLSQEQMDRISGVRCQLAFLKATEDEDGTRRLIGLLLGGDTDIAENWESGEFKSSFSGKRLVIDGNPVLVQIVSDSTTKDAKGKKIGGFEVYNVPIMLNERRCDLLISCNYPDETFSIIGATPESDSVIPSDEFYGLKEGDTVKPLYSFFTFTEDDSEENIKAKALKKYGKDYAELTEEEQREFFKDYVGVVTGNPFTIGKNIDIKNRTLPDGKYFYIFEFVNPIGGNNVRTEQAVVFKIADEKIVSVKHVDEITEFEDLED